MTTNDSLMDYYFQAIDKERNIYELAVLIEQLRKPIIEYVDILQDPISKSKLTIKDLEEKSKNNVIDFVSNNNSESHWSKLNEQFLNYHKSLSVYEIVNSMPIVNYTAIDSGIGLLKNITVADIGGGTGHTYCSFFQYPESIEYFLVDPNIRLLHDQFFRIFPKLSYLPMAHILAKAESLPFIDESFDLTMSLASIDHMEDYKIFIQEAKRITKKDGLIFISSHLDIPPSTTDSTKAKDKFFTQSFFERLTRYLYFRKHSVKSDDHTFHFETINPILEELERNGLIIEKQKVFKRYFYIVARNK